MRPYGGGPILHSLQPRLLLLVLQPPKCRHQVIPESLAVGWAEIVQQGVRCLVHWLGLQLGPVQPAPHNTESLRVQGDGVALLLPGDQVQEDLAACGRQ